MIRETTDTLPRNCFPAQLAVDQSFVADNRNDAVLVSNNSREHPHRITSGLPATRLA
jgi:hypothetical protein